MAFFLFVVLVVAGLAWIRLAPSDPVVWNVDPKVTADQDLSSGVRRRIPGDLATFERLHALILATPRSELLAGSPAEGRVTYITRSKLMGYPDYSTVQMNDGVLEIWGRQRFGASDLGVNKARVDGWLAALNAGQ